MLDFQFTVNQFRWNLFKIISSIGWAICPEPQKSDLQKNMPEWKDLEELK